MPSGIMHAHLLLSSRVCLRPLSLSHSMRRTSVRPLQTGPQQWLAFSVTSIVPPPSMGKGGNSLSKLFLLTCPLIAFPFPLGL
jgi:hypothetical protein